MRHPSLPLAVLLVAALGIGMTDDAEAQRPGIRIGLLLEHNSSNQPGLFVSLADLAVLRGHPRLTLSYSTTRLATAAGSNGLVKDRFLLVAGWYFRPTKRIDPYAQLQLGYARFNREDARIFALLDNDAPVVSLMGGVETRWLDDRVGVFADLGMSLISSSTVYPLVASVGLHYRIRGRAGS